MSRTVIIVGIGRSGTKLLSLLVSYMIAEQAGPLNFYYEPLLWNEHQANQVNPKGIQIHKSLPLFLGDSYMPSRIQIRFFDQFQATKTASSLSKHIRMSGRIPLLQKVFPHADILYIYRNPAEVIESIHNLNWSFHGPPYYESDYLRFAEEACQGEWITRHQIDLLEPFTWGKEALYWYALNKKAAYDLANKRVLVISLEQLVQNPRQGVHRICEYLGVRYKDEYLKIVGFPVENTNSINLLLELNRVRFLFFRFERALGKVPFFDPQWLGPMFKRPRPMTEALVSTTHLPIQQRQTLPQSEKALITEFSQDVILKLENLT